MKTQHLSFAWVTLLLVGPGAASPAHADGDCTPRPPAPAETQSYAAAYELFHRVAPAAPAGWTASDSPPTPAMPTLCRGSESRPMRFSFQRGYNRASDQQARDARAVQAYTDLAQRQQAQAAANQAQIAAIDAKIQALNAKVQEAVTAQRFGDIEGINRQMDALMKQRTVLAGLDQMEAQREKIDAEQSRDTEATFHLWFDVPRDEPRSGQPYRTSAGQALLSAHESGGNPWHDVHVYFAGAPRQAHVQVSGAPERVRALLDAADLEAIASFR